MSCSSGAKSTIARQIATARISHIMGAQARAGECQGSVVVSEIRRGIMHVLLNPVRAPAWRSAQACASNRLIGSTSFAAQIGRPTRHGVRDVPTRPQRYWDFRPPSTFPAIYPTTRPVTSPAMNHVGSPGVAMAAGTGGQDAQPAAVDALRAATSCARAGTPASSITAPVTLLILISMVSLLGCQLKKPRHDSGAFGLLCGLALAASTSEGPGVPLSSRRSSARTCR